jgi:pimeloyl-ACP methyl ester carboxylesterase
MFVLLWRLRLLYIYQILEEPRCMEKKTGGHNSKTLRIEFDLTILLSSLSQKQFPTLVIVGTDDIFTPSTTSLEIVNRIPAAWLVQIRDSGHGLQYHYPDQFSKVVSTFLDIV